MQKSKNRLDASEQSGLEVMYSRPARTARMKKRRRKTRAQENMSVVSQLQLLTFFSNKNDSTF